MTVCSHTGLTKPECSCRACLQVQVERHMPSLLGEVPQVAPIPEMTSVPGVASIEEATRGRRMLMRLRQARLRRAA